MNALKMLKSKTKGLGFSLIELMVVIAIVALLAAVAVPSYKSYIGKSRMAEVMGFITQFEKEWAERNALGTVPSNPTSPSSYISSIAYSSTGFTVTMAISDEIAPEFNNATAITATYTASNAATQTSSGSVKWTCVIGGGADATARATVVAQYFTNCT